MNLANQLKGILNNSEGMKPETRDNALRETIEYYQQWQQKLIDNAKEAYEKGSSFAEYHLRIMEEEKSLLEKVLKGETSFMNEVSKIEKDPDKHIKKLKQKPHGTYALQSDTILFFLGNFDTEPKARTLDQTIERLYLKK